LGALGIVLAFSFNGQPVFVMPLVFGCAPVVNTFLTMYLARTMKQAGPVFFAGLILVAVGAVTVLAAKPTAHAAASPMSAADFFLVTLFVSMTALAWGAYGPVLHKGQLAMHGSRLRPFLCVGLAYFVIAVLVPMMLICPLEPAGETAGEGPHWTMPGVVWSLAGGAAGALGALGIIMAFNFGGKPIYVMPLVFGGAPVVNSVTEIVGKSKYDAIGPLFYAGLILVIVGAVTVLLFAPKPAAHEAAGTGGSSPGGGG
jgi:hypothetical protein